MRTTTRPVTDLKPCKGDHWQRGCASGRPTVHRVTIWGATFDVCALHSPFDVSDERPAGSEILDGDGPQEFVVTYADEAVTDQMVQHDILLPGNRMLIETPAGITREDILDLWGTHGNVVSFDPWHVRVARIDEKRKEIARIQREIDALTSEMF